MGDLDDRYPGQRAHRTRFRVLVGLAALAVAGGLVVAGVAIGGGFDTDKSSRPNAARSSSGASGQDDCGVSDDIKTGTYYQVTHKVGLCLVMQVVAAGGQPVADQAKLLARVADLPPDVTRDAIRRLPAGATDYTVTPAGYQAQRNEPVLYFYTESWSQAGKPVRQICVVNETTSGVNIPHSEHTKLGITNFYRECGLAADDLVDLTPVSR